MKRMLPALMLALTGTAPAFDFDVGGITDVLTSGQSIFNNREVQDGVKAAESLLKGAESLTPEQEYYLGRATAAHLLQRYRPYNRKQLHFYLNSLTNYLAQFSSRPETFGGYHVQVVTAGTPGAWSAPGGFIVISRELLAQCSNEDELAGVLAHEIAHISLRHGLEAIKSSNLTEAGKIMGTMVLERQGGSGYQQLSQLTRTFGASVEDIVQVLVDSGYSQSQETEADEEGTRMLAAAGYGPTALADLIERKLGYGASGRSGPTDIKAAFNQTHPGGVARASKIRALIRREGLPEVEPSPARTKRFTQYLSRG